MPSSDFLAAADRVKNLPALPNEILLRLYALYKQVTEGEVKGSRPGIFDLRARAKYDAWASLRGVESKSAEGMYIDLVAQLESTHDHDD